MENTARRWSRIIPIAFIMYMTAYMDRINVSMVLPYMKSIHLTSADIGLASGIFFVGYMILQIPGAILANKWSAKKVVFILMILWSIMAMSTGLVQNKTQLFIARFLLGVFEGGVWPAVLVLLATWFPSDERARANAFWMVNLPLSAVIMAPITGWLLTITTWRNVFVIEGLLPLIWALVWLIAIDDNPKTAKWISNEEREYIENKISEENANKVVKNEGYASAFANGTVILLVIAYFFWMAGFYGYTMWVPSVVKSFKGLNSGIVGLITAVPFIFAIAGMVINSSWSDRRHIRAMHVAIPLLIGAFGLVVGQYLAPTPILKMIFLVISAIGVYSPYGPFWAIPTDILRPELAAAAMGLINAIGNLGGFLGPYIVGWIQTKYTGFLGFIILGLFLIITAIIALVLNKKKDVLSKGNA